MKRFTSFLIAILLAITGFSQTTLNEGFEGSAFPPTDWTTIHVSGSYSWARTTDYHHNGSACAYMHYTTGGNNWLITPKLVVASTADSLAFWAKKGSSGTTTISIKVSTTTLDTNSFGASIATYTPENLTTTFQRFSVPLSAYVGQNVYVAFQVIDANGIHTYIDDVTGPTLFVPSCPTPQNLAVKNLSSNGATVSWHERGLATSWAVEYKPSSQSDWSTANNITATDTSYDISSLTANTSYDVRVKSLCSASDESDFISAISFTTECDALTTLPFNENFDSYTTTGTTVYPSCWKRQNTYSTSTAYPYINSGYSYSGNRALYFYTSSSSYNLATLPGVDVSLYPMNTLKLKFKGRFAATTGQLQIGVMSNPNDSSTFTSVQTITPATAAVWTSYDVPLSSYIGTGSYIALKFVSSASTSLYIDDVTIDLIPSCAHPDSVVASGVSSSSIDVTFAPADPQTDNAWKVWYKASTDNVYTSEDVASLPYTIAGLSANTNYSIYATTTCSDGTNSDASDIITMKTDCDPVTTLPTEIEPFSTYGTGSTAYPQCWRRMTNSTTNYPYCSTVNADTALYFYCSTSGQYNIAIMPQIDPATSISSLTTSFDFIATTTAGRMVVGVMSNPLDLTTFTPVDTITSTALSTWETKEVDFASYTGTGSYIAFKNEYNPELFDASKCYIDDVTVYPTPNCPRVYNLAATGLITTAKVSWDTLNSIGSGYEISYAVYDSTSTFIPENGTIITVASNSEMPYMISNLSANTHYIVSVRQNCSGEWSDGVLFSTILATCTPTTIPYYADFSTSDTSAWIISNGEATNKWVFGASGLVDTTHNTMYVSNNGGDSNTYNITATSTAVASRLIEFTGEGQYTLSFNTRMGGESSCDYLKVFLVDPFVQMEGAAASQDFASSSYSTGAILFGGNNGTSATNPYLNYIATPTVKHNVTITLPYQGDNGTIKKLVFVWRNDISGGTEPAVSIDSVQLVPVACAAPALAVDSVGVNNIAVSWSSFTGPNSWTLYYKASADTAYDSVVVTNPYYNITGLTQNTEYNIYAVSNCNQGAVSSTSSILTARTLCPAITAEDLPIVENFDSYTTGASGTFPYCWRILNTNTTNYPYTASNYSVSGSNSAYFGTSSGAYSMAVIGRFDDAVPLNTLMVSFKALKTSVAYNLQVGVMTDPTDASTFSLISTVTPDTIKVWDSKDILLSSYIGEAHYIALKCMGISSANNMYIDDLKIQTIPSCMYPMNLTASNESATSAQIAWTNADSTISSWYVYYKTIGDTVWDSVVATTNPYTLTNLHPSAVYNLYVKTDCGGSLSESSEFINFRTACGEYVEVLPYEENFDSYTSVGSTNAFPNCWARPIVYNGYPYMIATSSRVHSSPNALEIHSATTVPSYVVTPRIGYDIHTLRAKFWAQAESATSSGVVEVGVMSNPTDTSTFELVYTVTPTSTAYTQYEVPFNNVSASLDTCAIAFRHKTVSSSYYYWLDDVVIDPIPDCARPTNVVAVDSLATTSSLNITFTPANETDASWIVYYKSASDTTFSSLTVNTNPAVITGLHASTAYKVFMRTNCIGAVSEVSDTITAFTACGAITTLPYTEGFESNGTGTSAYPQCWSKLSSASTNSTYIYTTNHVGGTHCLYWVVNSGSSIAALPQIDTSVLHINTLALQFNYTAIGASYPLTVGVMSNPNDASTFTAIASVAPAAAGYWDAKEVDFSSYTGNGSYIAFKMSYPAGAITAAYGVLDDVVLLAASDCPQTYSIVANNVSNSTIKVSWEGANANGNGWQLQYAALNDTTNINTIAVPASAGATYTLTNLNANTTYAIAVRQVCTSGAQWSDTILATTIGMAPTTLPYYSDFTDAVERSNWYLSNDTCANKWCWGTAGAINNGNYTLYISKNNGDSNVYNTSKVQTVTAMRQFISTGAGAYRLTFKERVAGESSYDYLKVFVSQGLHKGSATTPNWAVSTYSADGAILLGNSYYMSNSTATTTTHSVILPSQGEAGDISNLTFVWRQDASGGLQPPVSIDSISIEPLSCPPPTFTVDNMTTTSAQVSWSGFEGDSAWYIYYKQIDAEGYDSVAVTTSPYTISGLLPSTIYNIYMANNCASGLGVASLTQTFTTQCGNIVALPYTESFDHYGTGTGHYPTCWTKIATSTSTTASIYPYINSTNHSAPGALYFYASSSYRLQAAIMPAVDATLPMDSLMISFKAYTTSSNYSFSVGIMSDPTDTTTFDTIATFAPAASGSWTLYEVPLTNYTGTGRNIAFLAKYGSATNFGYIDDVVLDYTPSCFHPSAAVATNITSTGATLSWSGTSASYVVSCVSAIDTVTIATTDTTAVITGLTQSNNYTVYLRGVCSASDTSVYAPLMSFSTLQAPETIPYFCDFNALGSNGWKFTNGNCTNKWTVATPTGMTDGKLFVSGDNGLSNSYTLNSPSTVLAEKIFVFPADTTTLTFNLQIGGESTFDYIKVLLVPADTNLSASTLSSAAYFAKPTTDTYPYALRLRTSTNPTIFNGYSGSTTTGYYTDSIFHVSVKIPPMSTSDTTMKLIFVWRNDISGGNQPAATIDSVLITTANVCAAPTALAISTTNTHATLTWTAGGEESTWQVKLDNDTTITDVYSPTYTFTGLLAGTSHTAYVRANCGQGNSVWSSIQFTTDTAQIAPTVTTNAASAITQTTATFSGVYVQGTDTVTTVGFEYKLDTAAGWTDVVSVTAAMAPTVFTSNVTTLTANKHYQLRAYAVTATEGKTYGNVKTFQTLANVLPTVTTDTVQGITTSSATFKGTTVQGTEAIIARGFEYKKSEGTSWIDISATGTATISATATGLTAGTSYVYRAYAETQSDGKTYGVQKTFLTTSSLADVESDNVNVTMYPNPTESTTKLTISGVSGKVQIVISDVAGRVIETIEAKAENGTVQKVLNVSPFAKGVYYIRVITDKLNRTQKLIVR